MKSQSNYFIPVLLISYLILTLVLYILQVYNSYLSTDFNLIQRRIETPYKIWLNGYLGALFNIKYVGILHWLIVPLFYVFLKNSVNKLTPEIKAIVCAMALSSVLIGFKGFFNARYQLTFYPVWTIILLYLSDNFVKRNFPKRRNSFMLPILFLVLINNIVFITLLKDRKYVDRHVKKEGMLSRYQKNYENLNHFRNTSLLFKHQKNPFKKFFYALSFLDTAGVKSIPLYGVLQYLQDHTIHDQVLVNNYPMVYYYSNIKAVYYWSGDDIYFSKNGVKNIFKGRTEKQVTAYVLDSMNCKYLLSTEMYDLYNQQFLRWLKHHGKPLCVDNSDFILYEIIREPGNYSLDRYFERLNSFSNNQYNGFYVNDSLSIVTY